MQLLIAEAVVRVNSPTVNFNYYVLRTPVLKVNRLELQRQTKLHPWPTKKTVTSGGHQAKTDKNGC